jgi:iron complex transport system substrate-binding protein
MAQARVAHGCRPNAQLDRRRLLLGLCVLCSGCRARAQPTRSGPILRIVSLTPNTTETLFALGAGPLLVGRSRYCDYPPEASSLPVVGGYIDPSLEAILALAPDLVTGARGPLGVGFTERLQARGIRTFFPNTESIVAIQEMIAGLATVIDRPDAGRQLLQTLRARLLCIDQSVASLPRRSCVMVFGLSPIVVAGPGSFADEMLARARAENVVHAGPHYATVSIETLLGIDPDVIVDASTAEGHGTERIDVDRPGWKQLKAVREGRVRRVRNDAVLRPGPRIADGIASLTQLIHPGWELP